MSSTEETESILSQQNNQENNYNTFKENSEKIILSTEKQVKLYDPSQSPLSKIDQYDKNLSNYIQTLEVNSIIEFIIYIFPINSLLPSIPLFLCFFFCRIM